MTDPLLDVSVRGLLARIGRPGEAVSAGVAAASTCAMAAGLILKAARASADHWQSAGAIAAQARLLLDRASGLIQLGADTFGAAMSALRPPDDTQPSRALGPALEAAVDVSVQVCGTAADVVALAVYAGEHVMEDVRAEVTVAAGLALAAAAAAAHLVSINLAVSGEDARREEAEQTVRAARRACDALAAH